MRLGDGGDYAWIHLSWKRENQPAWLLCELIGGSEALDSLPAAWAFSEAADA